MIAPPSRLAWIAPGQPRPGHPKVATGLADDWRGRSPLKRQSPSLGLLSVAYFS